MKKKIPFFFLFLILLTQLIPFNYVSCDIEEETLYAIDDAYLAQAYPTGNTGTYTFMQLTARTGYADRMVVKFNFSDIPESTMIYTAKLRMYYYSFEISKPTNRKVNVHRLLTDWSEDSITWGNQPAYNSTISYTFNMPSEYDWIEMDIKEDVQKMVNGEISNYGWVIKFEIETGDPRQTALFYSKEKGEIYDPQVYINYKGLWSDNWEYWSHYEWKSNYDNQPAWFIYYRNQTVFQEWSFGLTFDEYTISGTWYWSHFWYTVNATVYDENEISTFVILVQHKVILPDILPNQFYICRVYQNGSLVFDVSDIGLQYVHVYIWRNGTDNLIISLLGKMDKDDEIANWIRDYNVTVGSTWFDNVQMVQSVEKVPYNGATVMIHGTKHDENIETGTGKETPYTEDEMSITDRLLMNIRNQLSSVGNFLYDLLPEPIKAIWNIVFGVLLTMVQFLLGELAPNILTYFAIYVIMLATGCFITATEIIGEEYEFGRGQEQPIIERVKGAFQPLFDLFIKMFEIGIGILKFVIDIIF